MNQGTEPSNSSTPRILIFGLVAVIIVLGLGLIAIVIAQAVSPTGTEQVERVDALANSNNDCVVCHRNTTPGIVDQYGHSTMAGAGVKCQDCHEVAADYPDAVEHHGTYVIGSPTTAMCETCHQQEVAQYYQSRHSLPAYVAVAGSTELSSDHLAMYEAIPEGSFAPDKSRNAIAAMEGPDMTPFTCESCHDIGAPAADGSVGQCQKCHLRHEFSLEQARKPETCNACHIGPDHPQWEIYQESPHGIAYATMGHTWNWEAEAGTLEVSDFPAPTCALCHMSGFGAQGTTHDVGDRLTWYLFAPISERRPVWQDNMVRMQGVCLECHNSEFVDDFYTAADKATERVNEWVVQSDEMMAPLKEQGLLTPAPFDEPIDFTYFELWHHWGRTAKFGVWMQGPDYSQWHGAYEVLSDLADLQEMVDQKLDAAAESTGQ
ncbi:MAG: nitrate reductase [Anaerolineales bacterium]|nr:nitrate reductase [Anaerolineae bacterium]MCB9132108.1 nitrate reductase [Anaerolineales bacterium]